jgi:polyphenol oxidase
VPGPSAYFSTRTDGDFRFDADPDGLTARRAAISAHPWTWLRQVHGSRVVTVTTPGEHAGEEADAAVTAITGAVLCVQTADCAPVVLVDARAGVIGIAHCGWKGLTAGVVERTVEAMRTLGAGSIGASIGPCIRPGCYEFGGADLSALAARYGDDIRATTTWGTPALDVVAAVHVALAKVGVFEVDDSRGCTACDPRRHFSHRARGESERHTTAVWRDEGAE